MRGDAGVGAKGELHAALAGAASHVDHLRAHFQCLLAHGRWHPAGGGRAFGHGRSGEQGRHEVALVGLQQLDGLAIQIGAVLDRIDTGAQRCVHAVSAVRVTHHATTQRVGSRHDGAQLIVLHLLAQACSGV
jgi:hypothetical protein